MKPSIFTFAILLLPVFALNTYAQIQFAPHTICGGELTINGQNHPVISWDANTEPNLVGYYVYRKINEGNPICIHEGILTTTTITDETFSYSSQSQNTAYYYVIAKDDDNDFSYPSETVSTTGYEPNSEGLSKEALFILERYDGLMTAPNPFNEKLIIKFVIEFTGNVNLSIFNIAGQKVMELYDGIANPNIVNQVRFNASNLSSGIYFCRLETENSVKHRKIVYLK